MKVRCDSCGAEVEVPRPLSQVAAEKRYRDKLRKNPAWRKKRAAYERRRRRKG